MTPNIREDILFLLERMDDLLDAPTDNPVELIKKLRGVTMNSIHFADSTKSALLLVWIANVVDVCTAYVGGCIAEGTMDPYRDVVKNYQEWVLSVAMQEIS